MTLEALQSEMITAMKNGDKFRKTVISGLVAQIKKAAIDAGRRNNIDEVFVDAQLTKAKKQAQESIDGAVAAKRDNLVVEYTQQYDIINSFAPQLITDEVEIRTLLASYNGERNKGAIMKWLKINYGSRVDMKVASKVAGEIA